MTMNTVASLLKCKQEGRKFSTIAAYDAIFARQLCLAGIDVILVGDSLGMVLQGNDSTIPVTIDDMCYHTSCVANGNDNASHWGGVMTRASRKRGVRGAIVDGGIRDTKDILEQRFPIWYRYRTSNGALSRSKITAYQVPIAVEGVIIKPGDLILADIDGALVVPRKLVESVLERAETIGRNEGEIKEWVDAGLSAEDIHERGGYF